MNEPNPGAVPPAEPVGAKAAGAPAAEEPAAPGPDKPEPPEPDLASEGGSFTAGAANNPNKSSGHLGFQHAAQQQLFGSTLQDAVMGNKNVGAQIFLGGADPKRLTVIRLSAETVDEANAFVKPGGYDRIARFAKDRSLLVLCGSAGSGRTATALHVLVAETGRRSIHEIHGDTDFELLAVGTLPRGTGIIMRDITMRAAARLDEFMLRRLDDLLTARGQKLIISAQESQAWGCGAVAASHTVELGDRPDPHEVLARQLRWRLGASRAAQCERLLGRPDVAAVVREHLGPERSLGEAARLAAILSDASAWPDTAAEAARAAMDTGSAADFEDWFDKLAGEQDERDQCYAIALAVLHGLSNEKVAKAGGQLERFLAPETAEARDERRPKRVFGSGNRTRLAKVRAIQAPPAETGPAQDPAPVVRFVHRDYPPRVLAHVWSEYDDARKGLTDWLRAVGDTPLEDVCVHAGVAVGALARVSYDHVFEEIVRPWALSGSINQQDAAAAALQTIGEDGRYRERVTALLGEWAEPGRPVSLQTTAARAYGCRYGAERLDTAVRVLGELAEREQWPVVRAVAWSLSELIASQAPGAAERVFELLGTWVGSRKPLLRSVGHLAFLFAAGDLVDQDSGIAEPGAKVPVFLRFDRDPRFAPIHRYLWVRVLSSTDMSKAARGVLTAWARTVQDSAVGRRALVEFLWALSGADPRAGDIVRLLTRDWTTGAPRVASALAGISGS